MTFGPHCPCPEDKGRWTHYHEGRREWCGVFALAKFEASPQETDFVFHGVFVPPNCVRACRHQADDCGPLAHGRPMRFRQRRANAEESQPSPPLEEKDGEMRPLNRQQEAEDYQRRHSAACFCLLRANAWRFPKASPAGVAEGRDTRPRAPRSLPRPAKSRELRSPGATDSVRWAWQAYAPTHGTWRAPRAPDSPAFHFVPLLSAPIGTPPSRSPTAPPKCTDAAALPPGAGRDASLRLRCAPLHENRRDRRFPRPPHHRA